MPVCATCGMEVAEEAVAGKIEYGGEILYFCCDHCKNAFMKNPEKFLSPKHEHSHHGEHGHHMKRHGGHSCCG